MSLIQILSAVGYLLLLLVIIQQIRICPGRGEPYALLVVAIHGVIYYTTLWIQKSIGSVDPLFWNTWSTALRLHGIFTIAAIEFLRWRRLERMNHGCG